MFYRVKKLPYVKRPWKVQVITYAEDKRKEFDLPPLDLERLGFRLDFTYEQACKRRDQLNAQAHEERHEERRDNIRKRLSKEENTFNAWLPKEDVSEFETDVLYGRFVDEEFIKRNKIESHWRAARRMMCELKIDPVDWFDKRTKFYDYCSKSKFSPAYVQKIYRILNMWGSFHSRKYRRFFEPLPFPKGIEKERIADSYYEKENSGQESDPISPNELESKKASLEIPAYNWVFLSVWFGLRPIEVESLKNPKYFRIETHEGKAVLFVYQSKLKGVSRDKRWKYIPCMIKQQEEGLRIIASGVFKRPSRKIMKARFGDKVGLYGGRKAFEKTMYDLGYSFQDVSLWLGHKDISRTWKNYVNKMVVRVPKN